MKKNFVFKKLSPELEEVLMEELHTLKGGNGGGSDGSKWDGDLKEVEIVGEAPPPDPPGTGDGDNYPDPEPEEDPDWDDDWGGDSNPDEPEEKEKSDCDLKYDKMPQPGNQQTGATCAPAIFGHLNAMLGKPDATTDAVLDRFASEAANGETSGQAFEDAKKNLEKKGIGPDKVLKYLNDNYNGNEIDPKSYGDIQNAIQAGKPIFGTLYTPNEAQMFHAVLITGVNKNGKITYFDPAKGDYVDSKFENLVKAEAIDMGSIPPNVKCK